MTDYDERLPLALRIFEQRDGHRRQAYQFVMPGISISGVDLPVEFRDGRWHITQADLPTPIEVDGESTATAVLALIARRLGYAAEFHPLPDEQAK